jgi:hypothetical protein
MNEAGTIKLDVNASRPALDCNTKPATEWESASETVAAFTS